MTAQRRNFTAILYVLEIHVLAAARKSYLYLLASLTNVRASDGDNASPVNPWTTCVQSYPMLDDHIASPNLILGV